MTLAEGKFVSEFVIFVFNYNRTKVNSRQTATYHITGSKLCKIKGKVANLLCLACNRSLSRADTVKKILNLNVHESTRK